MHHDAFVFLLSLAVLLGTARLLGELSRRMGLPAVVGEIVTGLFIGKTVLGRFAPAAFAWLFPEGPAKTFLAGYTNVAVILLLVVAGLEIDLTVMRKSGRVVVLTSALGVIIPFVLGIALGYVLPDSALADPSRRGLHAAFLGIALAISALPVIAKTLLDLGLMKTEIGIIILSSAVVDDLVGWIGFSVLARQFTKGSASVGQIAVSVLLTAAFVLGSLLVIRPLADRLLARMQVPGDAESGRVLSVIMVLALLGASATEALGMHAVFGAFVMGVAIGDSSRLREHTRQVLHDFVAYVFTPVFFASMALRFDFMAALDPWLTATVLAIACVAKIGGCTLGARLSGVAWRESAAIGFGKNSRGAMEILLALIALEAGIINQRLFVALVITAIVTSVISGPALARLLRPALSPIAALLRDGVIVLDPKIAIREELIAHLAGTLAAHIGRPEIATQIAATVLEREAMGGTGVGDGVAFPHAGADGIDRPYLAFARLQQGLDFDAPDAEAVRLVFLLVTPTGDYNKSLQILSGMARLLTRPEVRHRLLRAQDAATVLGDLEQADRPSESVRSVKT